MSLEKVNSAGCWDFRIKSFDGWTLEIVGGQDLSYSEIVRTRFTGTSYISCPCDFSHAKFRLATASEIENVRQQIFIEEEDIVYAISGETSSGLESKTFFVVAEGVEVIVKNSLSEEK